MVRVSTVVIAALPIVLFAWAVVGLIVPDLGMHDGDA
jgi:hypothetical protein